MASGAERYRVVIVGGGLLGTALAYHLARSNESSVCVVDQGAVGSGATARGAGVLTFQGWDPWDLDLVRESATEYRAIGEATGRGDFRRNGGVRVARTAEGARWLERAHAVLREHGVASRLLPPAELVPLLPWGTFEDVRSALLTPDDATFSAAELARAYARRAVEMGVAVRERCADVAVGPEGDGWAVRAGDVELSGELLVLAAGAGTKRLAAGFGTRLPLAPFRTQAATLRPAPLVASFPTLHDLDLDLYVRPWAPGRLLAGDGTEHREADPRTANLGADPAFVARVVHSLQEIRPADNVATEERSWAGLCVASPDRYPLVGRVPGRPGLLVASGFNGLGAMRAGALARRLAAGLLHDRWEPLGPADPGRFPSDLPAFDPAPEFPLESPEDAFRDEPPVPEARVGSGEDPTVELAPLTYRSLGSVEEVDRLLLPPLSDWFDPYLALFLKDALRTGGLAELAEADGEIRGVYLTSPTEQVGSVFTRTRSVAEHYLEQRGPGGVYADRPWVAGGEPIEVLAADLRDWTLRAPVRNPVRLAQAHDLPAVSALMQEVAGSVDDTWMRTLPRPEELCFLCEIDGRLAGVSWASVAHGCARGHSFMVRPRFRGLGVGTDLLHARMLWLQSLGVTQVVSEIYEGNAASRTAAERAGMAVVDRMYHYR